MSAGNQLMNIVSFHSSSVSIESSTHFYPQTLAITCVYVCVCVRVVCENVHCFEMLVVLCVKASVVVVCVELRSC